MSLVSNEIREYLDIIIDFVENRKIGFNIVKVEGGYKVSCNNFNMWAIADSPLAAARKCRDIVVISQAIGRTVHVKVQAVEVKSKDILPSEF